MTYQITEFAPETEPNPWDDAVHALVAATQDNPNAAITIEVPAGVKKDGTDAEGAAERVKFQKAARTRGFTARVRKVERVDAETYALTFQLTTLNKARRGKVVDSSGTDSDV